MATPLAIREDKKEIYVQGLSEYNVKSVSDTLQLLKVAEDNRAIRETFMNQFSSRSHSIFQIYVEHKRLAEDGGGIYIIYLYVHTYMNTYIHTYIQKTNKHTYINTYIHAYIQINSFIYTNG